ncbi:MAG: MFS transporter [Thermaerobacter sp.]|nr:MFS transporter [Thermaerobacter sp.]
MISQDSPYLGWPGRRRLSVGNQLALTFYWFPNNVLWTGLLLIVMPAKVISLVGMGASTSHLSMAQFIGDAAAVLAAPIFGAISDRWRTRVGRRRPQMIVGVIGNVIFFLIMGFATNFTAFVIGFVGVQIFNNVTGSAYAGLIPDLVPPEQRGLASGFMGIWNNAAVLVGAGLALALAGMGYWFATAVLLLLGVAITFFFVREPAPPGVEPFRLGAFLRGFWIVGREYRDFWWVFATRFLVMMGLYVLEYFLSYYLRFVMHIANPNQDIFLILAMLTVTALLSVLLAGYISDRLGKRKILVSIAGVLMGACSLLFVFMHSLSGIFVAALLFGIGYGTYLSTDYALVVDTLPGKMAAKDMGIWGLSTTVPQILSAILGLSIASLVIPHFGYSAGYRLMFAITFVLFLLGSILVWKVKKVA